MNKPNAHHGKTVPLGTAIGDLCSIVTFASASGIAVDEVVEWVENGTLLVFAIGLSGGMVASILRRMR